MNTKTFGNNVLAEARRVAEDQLSFFKVMMTAKVSGGSASQNQMPRKHTKRVAGHTAVAGK